MKAIGMIEVIGLPPALEAADAALKAANVTLLAIAKADAGILTIEITGDVGAVTAAVDAGAAAASRIGTLRAKHIIPRVDDSLMGKVIMPGTKLFQPKKKPPVQTPTDSKLNDITREAYTIGRDDSFGESTLIHNDNKIEVPSDEQTPSTGSKQAVKIDTGYATKTEVDQAVKADNGYATKTEVNQTVKTESNQTEKSETEQIEKTQDTIEYTAAELKKKSNDALREILKSRGVELTEQHKNAKKQELIQLILTKQNRR